MTTNMYIFDISLISFYSQESFKQVTPQGHLQSKHVLTTVKFHFL
jgi:hypothetical protein